MKPKSYILRGIAVLVAAAAVGCSPESPKQEFTLPKTLCGVSVPTDALSRLLPASGKRLEVEQVGELSKGSMLCNITVDGTMVLVVNMERIVAGDSAQHILLRRLSISQQKSANAGTIAYTDWAAVSLVKCRGSDVQVEDISTLIKVLKPARHDESAMRDLISGYTTALKKQQPCTPRYSR